MTNKTLVDEIMMDLTPCSDAELMYRRVMDYAETGNPIPCDTGGTYAIEPSDPERGRALKRAAIKTGANGKDGDVIIGMLEAQERMTALEEVAKKVKFAYKLNYAWGFEAEAHRAIRLGRPVTFDLPESYLHDLWFDNQPVARRTLSNALLIYILYVVVITFSVFFGMWWNVGACPEWWGAWWGCKAPPSERNKSVGPVLAATMKITALVVFDVLFPHVAASRVRRRQLLAFTGFCALAFIPFCFLTAFLIVGSARAARCDQGYRKPECGYKDITDGERGAAGALIILYIFLYVATIGGTIWFVRRTNAWAKAFRFLRIKRASM